MITLQDKSLELELYISSEILQTYRERRTSRDVLKTKVYSTE